MASVNVTIIYSGPVVDDIVRKGMSIPRYFEPRNSYVDSPVFTDGFNNTDNLGDGESYGKSIYATNVDGWGDLPGLIPMEANTTRFAQYQRAIFAAKEAKDAGTKNEGITFAIEGYEEVIYWTQIGRNMVDEGFYTKVGDEEFGPNPNPESGS